MGFSLVRSSVYSRFMALRLSFRGLWRWGLEGRDEDEDGEIGTESEGGEVMIFFFF